MARHGSVEVTIPKILSALPANWRDQIASKALSPIASGMSGAQVFRVSGDGEDDQYLKFGTDDNAIHLRNEIERTEWLGSMGVRVPKTIMRFDKPNVSVWLMTSLGSYTVEDARAENWKVTVSTIAHAFAAIHSLPAENCPFDETRNVRLHRALSLVQQGKIDPTQFDARNAGLTSHDIYRRLESAVPIQEDIVVVHGDATLSNLVVGRDGSIGFVDCGTSGRADRYVDLSLLIDQMQAKFGAEAKNVFISKYMQMDWDRSKADFYRDLYELF